LTLQKSEKINKVGKIQKASEKIPDSNIDIVEKNIGF